MPVTKQIQHLLHYIAIALLLSVSACQNDTVGVVRPDNNTTDSNSNDSSTKGYPSNAGYPDDDSHSDDSHSDGSYSDDSHSDGSHSDGSHSSDNSTANTTNFALLVGIGKYPEFPLDGPPYDLIALKDILPRWGFAPQNITILEDQQATHAGVLQALNAMAGHAKPGNKIFIYFSGHGTSIQDPKFGGQLPLPYTSGALVPIDFAPGTPEEMAKSLLVGRNDIRPILEKIDNTGAQIVAIFDSCYSGNSVRAFSPGLRERRIQLKYPDEYVESDSRDITRELVLESYPYKNVVYLGAAAESQPAMDISRSNAKSTVDGKPHGAFTNVLLKVLNGEVTADINNDGALSPAELNAAINPLVSQQYRQTPQILPSLNEDTALNQQRGFFAIPTIQNTTQSTTDQNTNVASDVEIWAPLQIWVEDNVPQTTQGLERVDGVAKSKGIDTADVRLVRSETEVEMVLPNGNPLARYSTTDAEVIERAMIKQVQVSPLRKLHHSNANFQIQIERSGSGTDGVAVEGNLVGFSVRSTRDVYYLALDIDPEGKVSVLYPNNKSELAMVPANKVVDLMEEIRVIGPFGTDYVKVFAFSSLPDGLEQWVGLTGIAPDDAKFADLACLVGLAMPGSGKNCPSDGIAEATFTLATYPASEVKD